MTNLERVKAWQQEFRQNGSASHWGNWVDWGTAFSIAQRLDDEALREAKNAYAFFAGVELEVEEARLDAERSRIADPDD